MSLNLIAKKLDFETGGENIVLINEKVATEHGINPGDHIVISKKFSPEIVCIVDTTQTQVTSHYIGLYRDIYEKYGINDDEQLLVEILQKPESIEFIKKKIKKHTLSEEEIHGIVQDIVNNRLGLIEKTYFLSTIYNPGYNDEELYFFTKAMAETGSMISFDGIVADKHSIGGIAGKGITPIVVSIVSSFGIKIPNTSSRSITTPAGTTDILESVANVSFSVDKLKELMDKMNCFMVWGGGLSLAPADEELIRIERPLGIESYDKFIVSILAKKVAMGVNTLLIDVPAGPGTKVYHPEDIKIVKDKFTQIGKRFGINVTVSERYPKGIDGNAVGPLLEMREVLYVLENNPLKSQQLEDEAVRMAGILLEMCNVASYGNGVLKAKEALENGNAFAKFKEIIKNQGGSEDITADKLSPTSKSILFKSVTNGKITKIDNKKIVGLARILGCPLDKAAGIYLYKKPEDTILVGEKMFNVYSSSADRLDLSIAFIQKNNLFEIIAL